MAVLPVHGVDALASGLETAEILGGEEVIPAVLPVVRRTEDLGVVEARNVEEIGSAPRRCLSASTLG